MTAYVVRIVSGFCLTVFLAFSVPAQDAINESPRLLDAIEEPNCEYLLANLDTFALRLQATSGGHIVLFGGPDPIANVVYERYLRRYIRKPGLNRLALKVLTAKSGGKIKIEFWLGPVGASPPVEPIELTRRLSSERGVFFFDGDSFESFVENGRRSFVGTSCAACCLSSLDWSILDEFLVANTGTRAYVVIRGPSFQAAELRSYLAREIKEAGVSRRRVKYLFAPKNLVNSNHFNEVEVFISRKEFKSAYALKSHDFAPGG